MLEFLRSIVKYNIVIYAVLGLAALFFLRIVWLARKDKTRSIFTLERESANSRIVRAFIGLLFVLSLGLGVYYLSQVTPTIVPPPQETPTPTPILALPPTPTPPPLLIPTPTPTITPTPLPSPQAEVEPTFTPVVNNAPTPPPLPPANCPNPGVRLTRPGNGARVAGVIQVNGVAAIENFDYYKFEFRGAGGDWSFIERHNAPVNGGVLGSWNTDTVAPGEYELRLVVVDTSGNYPEPCIVRLIVE